MGITPSGGQDRTSEHEAELYLWNRRLAPVSTAVMALHRQAFDAVVEKNCVVGGVSSDVPSAHSRQGRPTSSLSEPVWRARRRHLLRMGQSLNAVPAFLASSTPVQQTPSRLKTSVHPTQFPASTSTLKRSSLHLQANREREAIGPPTAATTKLMSCA